MMTYRGFIEEFQGSYMSGIAAIVISGKSLYCENGPTVRALEGCFGNVIDPGHTASIKDHVRKREIVYSVDDMGMLLCFTPLDQWEGPEIPEEGIDLTEHTTQLQD